MLHLPFVFIISPHLPKTPFARAKGREKSINLKEKKSLGGQRTNKK